MTKKDYELIAGVIAELVEHKRDKGAFAHNPELSTVADFFADTLADTNPRFNREIFLKACGVN
jgi:hypothetical protein